MCGRGENITCHGFGVGKRHVVGWVDGDGTGVDIVLLGLTVVIVGAGEEGEGSRAGGTTDGTFAGCLFLGDGFRGGG